MLPMAAELSADVEAFIAAFSENWHASGQGRTEGRLLAYLLVVNTDKVLVGALTQRQLPAREVDRDSPTPAGCRS